MWQQLEGKAMESAEAKPESMVSLANITKLVAFLFFSALGYAIVYSDLIWWARLSGFIGFVGPFAVFLLFRFGDNPFAFGVVVVALGLSIPTFIPYENILGNELEIACLFTTIMGVILGTVLLEQVNTVWTIRLVACGSFGVVAGVILSVAFKENQASYLWSTYLGTFFFYFALTLLGLHHLRKVRMSHNEH